MKKLLLLALFFILIIPAHSQQAQNSPQNATATLKSSARLFGAKDDLTTVIMIIPSGSKVSVIGSDSSYLHVSFEENEGYIFKRQAIIDAVPGTIKQNPVVNSQPEPKSQPGNNQTDNNRQTSRFSYLENKYGSALAARINSGKIWKGMTSEMVTDSWGRALKVNRVFSGNVVKEEWIYKNSWLYFQDNILTEWGQVRQ